MAQIFAELTLWFILEALLRAPGYAVRQTLFAGRPVSRHLNREANDILIGLSLWVSIAVVAWLVVRGYN